MIKYELTEETKTLADGTVLHLSPDEGKLLRKSWAKIVQLQAVNDKMREALLIIAGGKEARGNYEEVAWHMAQLAAEALAAEGGATANGREDSNENETTQEDN